MNNSDMREIRLSAQTADGIGIYMGLFVPNDMPMSEVNTLLDDNIEILSRQRAKVALIAEREALEEDKKVLDRVMKDFDDVGRKRTMEQENRANHKSTDATESQYEAIRNQMEQIKQAIENRKRGIKSLEKLVV